MTPKLKKQVIAKAFQWDINGPMPDAHLYKIYTEDEQYAAWRKYLVSHLCSTPLSVMSYYTCMREELLGKLADLRNASELKFRWTDEEVNEVFTALLASRLEEFLRSRYRRVSADTKSKTPMGWYQTSVIVDDITYHIYRTHAKKKENIDGTTEL